MKTKKKNEKKVFSEIWDNIRPEFVGFICGAGWLLFASSSAQISMGGRLNLDEGTLTFDGGTRPPYNLSTGFCDLRLKIMHWVLLDFNFKLLIASHFSAAVKHSLITFSSTTHGGGFTLSL